MIQTANTLNVSDFSTLNILAVGADIGNLHARVQWGSDQDSRANCESYVLDVTHYENVPGSFHCISSTAQSNPWVGKSWTSGLNAMGLDPMNGDRVMDDHLGKVMYSFALLTGLLWSQIEEDSHEIKLAISAHNPSALEEKIKATLDGEHTVRDYSGVCKTFKISIIKVYAEGVGVIRTEKLAKSSFLGDLGSRTLLGSAFAGYNPKCDPWNADNLGGRDLIRMIASCSEVSKTLGRVATFEEVLFSLENSEVKGKKTKYLIGTADITSAVECEAEKWLNQSLKQLSRAMQSQIDAATDKVMTGGCCCIPKVKELLEAKGYRVVTDPVWSNVNGLYEIAAIKSQANK